MPILPPPLIHHAQEETRSTAQYSISTQGNVDHHARRNACVIRTLLLLANYMTESGEYIWTGRRVRRSEHFPTFLV